MNIAICVGLLQFRVVDDAGDDAACRGWRAGARGPAWPSGIARSLMTGANAILRPLCRTALRPGAPAVAFVPVARIWRICGADAESVMSTVPGVASCAKYSVVCIISRSRSCRSRRSHRQPVERVEMPGAAGQRDGDQFLRGEGDRRSPPEYPPSARHEVVVVAHAGWTLPRVHTARKWRVGDEQLRAAAAWNALSSGRSSSKAEVLIPPRSRRSS